ncbi:lysine efflux permease [Sanguibacter keddieii DSM 10542]|uniref:Lysine efflux permease n=1 Tax=Sanguibacter keddieii (strain ATCC 51767 / DSM 10542 / NCFB 3025 / ST-74) TaxID=446469 RepID=D1BHX3_SANKS|nr:LysE/ArgO family amino acid transporter [Sanguibacter keddieii]ACZ22043.1 lysine efflux permease [Sanguibacter keddieii DSM 10542]
MPTSLLAALSGAAFGLSLIVAIGAQNVFVLRQGLRRSHVLPVVLVCAVSDVVLISAGVAGLGGILDRAPGVATAARVAGAAFLLGYAVLAARRALRPAEVEGLEAERGTGSRSAAVLTALALTWLNPHVYLDTVLLLGSVAASHGDLRWWFGLGATTASLVWFTALGFGARLVAPLFARPGAWRVLDGAIAVVMLAIAVGLLAGI